jgi:hypothetical protein
LQEVTAKCWTTSPDTTCKVFASSTCGIRSNAYGDGDLQPRQSRLAADVHIEHALRDLPDDFVAVEEYGC